MSLDATVDETHREGKPARAKGGARAAPALVLVATPVGRELGTVIPLGTAPVTIGRVGADGVFDTRMSRRHATVEQTPHGACVRDGAAGESGWRPSANHTYVSGVRIGSAPVDLGPRDTIRTGHSVWMLVDAPETPKDDTLLVGVSAALGRARRELALVVNQVARALADGRPVTQSLLVGGPRGSGKQVVAREAHRLLSARLSPRDVPFREVSAPSLADGTGAADLFGVVERYATGVGARAGYFEQAHGGVLLLDEVGDIPEGVQAKLLNVLQERKVTRLGSKHPTPFDCLVVGATNRPFPDLVAQGAFRQDLLDRLGRFRVHLPSLDERPEDIPFLARTLLARHGYTGELAHDLTVALVARRWPGNVRDLDIAIERVAGLAALENVPVNAELLERAMEPLDTTRRDRPSESGTSKSSPALKARPERDELVRALEAHDWNQAAVARHYGKHARQVGRWMSRYGIERPD